MQSISKLKNNLFVAQALAASVKTLLGPLHSVKCCVSEDESIICSSAVKLLQFIDVEHPAGFVINDACQGLYNTYGKGCKTMVCLIGFWSRAAQNLLEKGVPVPIIVKLFEEALDRCLLILKSIAIPLDISKLVHNRTTNSYSTTSEEDSQEWKGLPLKHSAVNKLSDTHGVSNESIITQEELRHRTIENKIGFIADTEKCTIVSNSERHKLQLETDDHCSLPNVEGGGALVFPEVEDESLDYDQDVSWFFGSQSCSLPATSVLEESLLPSVFPSGPTSRNSEFPTLRQGEKKALWLDEPWKAQLESCSSIETQNTNFKTAFCTLGKSSLVCNSSNAHSGDNCTSCYDILERPEDSLPGSTSVLDEKSVTEQLNWQNVDIYSNIFGSPKRTIDIAESTLEVQKVEFNNRLATLLQQKHGKLKPDITSLSKYSRMISFREPTLSVQSTSSFDKSSPTPVDNDPKGACESVDSSSDDEFSACFDDVPAPVDAASNIACSMSKTFRGQPTTRQNVSASETNAELLGNLSHQSRVPNVEKGLTNLLRQQQKEDMSISDITRLSKYSRVVSGFITSQSEAEVSSFVLDRSQRDFDMSSVDRKCAVKHHRLQVPTNGHIVTNLKILGKRLSHGKKREMDLAVQVVQAQVNYAGETLSTGMEIDTKLIHVETVVGPPSLESQVIDGLVIEVDDIEANLLKKLAGKPQSIVLVNGDITPEFQHLGLKETTPLKQVLRCEDDLKNLKNDRQLWLEQIEKTLNTLKIGVVIVKGVVDDMVADHCRAAGIVVLQKVMISKLQLLSVSCGATITTYLTDIRTTEVGGPITVDFFECGWTPFTYRNPSTKLVSTTVQRTYFVVLRNVFDYQHEKRELVASRCAPLQTVLISGPSRDIACDTEMNFWSCFHSLKNTMSCKRVLPGAGDSERASIQELERLRQRAEVKKVTVGTLWTSKALDEFRPVVYSAFIEGIETYLMSVLLNSGQFTINCHALTFLKERLQGTSSQTLPNLKCHRLLHLERFDADGMQLDGSLCQVKREGPELSTKKDTPVDETQLRYEQERSETQERSSDIYKDCIVWDDFVSKCEAWRRAVGVVLTLLQSDILITTGVNSSNQRT